MIKDWLASYQPKSKEEMLYAMREIMQEIALAGLYRAGFFEKAAFYGGTALRIFHGLDRFSEDLDFSLLKTNPNFSFEKYTIAITTEFNALGMEVSVKEKQKKNQTQIDSAFLKPETLWRELEINTSIAEQELNQNIPIKIKLEVDTQPPPGFETEEKLLLKPFSFYVKCFSLSDLFAGKMHALLFRKWIYNVKGRDWYDFEWYVKKGIALNLDHLQQRAISGNDLQNNVMSKNEFQDILIAKIESVDFERAKADIIRFIPNPDRLQIWSKQYFTDLIPYIKYKH